MFLLLLLVPLASGLWLLPSQNMAGHGHGHGLVVAGHGHGHGLDLAKHGHLDMAGYGRLTAASPSLYIGVSGTDIKIG